MNNAYAVTESYDLQVTKEICCTTYIHPVPDLNTTPRPSLEMHNHRLERSALD